MIGASQTPGPIIFGDTVTYSTALQEFEFRIASQTGAIVDGNTPALNVFSIRLLTISSWRAFAKEFDTLLSIIVVATTGEGQVDDVMMDGLATA